ncbi:ArsB/NhaD family transporter [Desulfogranum japonicum]|uniref:SLC13 family permease n=1 Tax=Desulfogranum japonicum TaxID=231447 RepID=UPI00040DAF76|nr:ArsB/NhaD family transporter [Desulfogranum japonicum]
MHGVLIPDSFHPDLTFWVALSTFLIALFFIISEKIHKTIVALAGASFMLVLKVLDQHEAFHLEEYGVDWNVIFLLVGMMITISLMRPTGIFEYVAIRSAKLGRGEPVRILVIFSIITAILSALLDNVTTVLLIAPVTLLVAEALRVDPIPFLIIEALSSNIGGTATLIGDPPNIMIGSKARMDFLDFLVHLAPVVIIMMIVFLVLIRFFFRSRLTTQDEFKQRIMAMDEREAIQDVPMLVKSLTVLGVVLVGFILHGKLNYEPATVALFGAGLLLLLSKNNDPQKILAEIEWSVIFFFIGLFVMVGGLVKVGVITLMSSCILSLTHGDLFQTSMLILWFSSVASAVVDNIPYVATMTPLVVDMAQELWPDASGVALLQHPELLPVWWSLALGACLGGNGSPIGASANVIVLGAAEKAGYRISFRRFLAYGIPVTLLTVFLSTIYIWLRYYVF